MTRAVGCTFALVLTLAASSRAADFDVKSFGAVGDGKAVETAAINKAINAAALAGGGVVRFPAGTYRTGSIHLRSHLTLFLDPGALLEADADPASYDPAEPSGLGEKESYQDFGHCHWHNSLIWGENLVDVSVQGQGRIDGTALSAYQDDAAKFRGMGNKAIALKNCRHVLLRDITIRRGGWFGLLATGVDDLTIDNLRVDTGRDGFDIDSCQHVRVSNCVVNSPVDDGICLKSSFGLGYARDCQDITITNCQVSGYDIGSLLDGTYTHRTVPNPQGRIKLGTESNGGFKNITISNCVFDHCNGLALETVDGGSLEDVTISNITMRDVFNAPIYLRLGARLRGPAGVGPGRMRRITIDNVVASNVQAHMGIIIAGLAAQPIQDVILSNIFITYQGGGTAEQAQRVVPEYEKDYPDPSHIGVMPSYGLFARHVQGLDVENVRLGFEKPDLRPGILLDEVASSSFDHLRVQHAAGVSEFLLHDVHDFDLRASPGLADRQLGAVTTGKL